MTEGMICMEVIIAGSILIIAGVLVCYFNYRIENKILDDATGKKGKIVKFRSHKRRFRFMKKKNKAKRSKKANQYGRRVNSY